MVELWFALLCFTLVLFVVLDGWNIGAGALHLVVARTGHERREVVAAIGPLWSWHEVWLLAAGGTFLMAFPRVMAVSFAGFYLALWMVLWTLVLRGLSLEIGGHIHDSMWQAAWDFVFAVSSLLLAILFGAALGNVLRGVPLDGRGQFSLSLFTNFRPWGQVGILDWYTVSVAVLTTALLSAHGATYLRLKTSGRVHERSEGWARGSWLVAAVLFVMVTLETQMVRPELFQGLIHGPVAWLGMIVTAAGVWGVWTGLRGPAEGRAFAGSCAVLAGLLAAAAASLFPVMLHSTMGAEHSLTAYNGAASEHGLRLALLWWPIAFALAMFYLFVVLRSFEGKVRLAPET